MKVMNAMKTKLISGFRMKSSVLFIGIALGAGVLGASTFAPVQSTKDLTKDVAKDVVKDAKEKVREKVPAAPVAPAAGDEMAKMMAAFEKAANLGPEHHRLAKLAGTWDLVVEMWMAPGTPSSKSNAVMTADMILGGRYLRAQVIGESFAGPQAPKFEGMLIEGFDNVSKRWTTTWIDNMGTGVMRAEATAPADAKKLEWIGTANDPLTGKPKATREVQTFDGDDRWTSEMYDKGPDGKEFVTMKIMYTRQKK